jgi:hypothetical protein
MGQTVKMEGPWKYFRILTRCETLILAFVLFDYLLFTQIPIRQNFLKRCAPYQDLPISNLVLGKDNLAEVLEFC